MIFYLVARQGREGDSRTKVDRVPVLEIKEKMMYDLLLCKVRRGSHTDDVWVHHGSLQETVAGAVEKAVRAAPLSPQPRYTPKEGE